jgi:HEAT repeat protein
MNLVRRTGCGLVLLAVCLPVGVPAQPAAAQAAATAAAVRLALRDGRVADAALMADALVRQQPRSRDAAAVQIEARAAADEAGRAFAAYDRFANLVGAHDAKLLEPLALHQLRVVVANTDDPRLTCAALERLARSGDEPAFRQLRQISEKNRGAQAGAFADAALARLGDGGAVSRLSSGEWTAGVRDKNGVVEILDGVPGPAATAQLRGLLDEASPQTRSLAAAALARRGDKDSIAALRSMLSDEWPEVRSWAALALRQLGDSAGDETVARMMKSPVAEVRVDAVMADRSVPDAARKAELKAALDDASPEVRLKAAKALATFDPAAARPALAKLTADGNAAIRTEAAAALEELAPIDVGLSRRLMTDGSDWVRVHAAGAALKAAAAK